MRLDSNDITHVSWMQGAGSNSALFYWNNTPTTATEIASSLNNYIGYLLDGAFVNPDYADGRRYLLQSRYQRDADNSTVAGTGEKTTYSDWGRGRG